jgi:predicted CXXCH cytochrome family protein
MPVLVTGARSQILSTATSFNLSALTANDLLTIKIDGGGDVIRKSSGADTVYSGNISLPIAASTTCVYANLTAATPAEVAACLNANAAFAVRAIAWDEGGKLGIRSRSLGKVYSLQLSAGTVTTALFGAGATVTQLKLGGAGGDLRSDKGDPKVTRDSGAIYYQLDSVDDLEPGTYVATVEIADRGRVSADNYKTPTVAKVAFQVKTGTEEQQVAGSCNLCHENKEGKGQVFDPSRHRKIFDATAVDQCGACHDYQPGGSVTGSGWSGATPISKRVHAVHYGAQLNYPVITVDHADEPANRFWDIEFPQDIRNCETCHSTETSSGTWATKAARIPCMGCHDDDAAVSHMKSMVYDPTPADLWNGDEQEACMTCH